ncbi:BglII/BstYI family type II restriction endonuclease [Paraburkholderia sp. A3RO-2L]|jgi:hypothetical protein|uniref:BglII/BstYI family type II restriction endonuclease n=1 Tax=unclassified Paraburkholderia TaxID=2615204 RepID=UPI003DA972FE
MQVFRFDHNTERALQDESVRNSVSSLLTALARTPVPFWRGKSEKQGSKSILQPVLNAYIEQELVEDGWEREYKVTGDEDGPSGMRIDFCRFTENRLIAVEVQFGNVGRYYGDEHKFLHLQAAGRLAIAVHVVLTDETARLTDSGISTYETSVRRIQEVAHTIYRYIPVPLICLGLSHEGSELVDFSKSRFPNPKILQGEGAKASISHAVSELRRGVALEMVAPPAVIRAPLRTWAPAAQAELL